MTTVVIETLLKFNITFPTVTKKLNFLLILKAKPYKPHYIAAEPYEPYYIAAKPLGLIK